MQAGIQTVLRQLARRGDGTRGLYVSPGCVHTIAEYGSYQYADRARSPRGASRQAERAAASEQPLKANDHAMDATRYALHSHLGAARATEAYLAEALRG